MRDKSTEIPIEEYFEGFNDRMNACYEACKGLTDPEKQLNDLISSVRHLLNELSNAEIIGPGSTIYGESKVRTALEPFRGKHE